MNLFNDDFYMGKKEQHEYDNFGVLPFELRLKIKNMVKDYEEHIISDDDVLTIIKDLSDDNKEKVHDCVLSMIDFFEPEEVLLDLCELIKPLSDF